MSSDTRYSFMVEWLDPQASIIRSYMLFYYPSDSSLEMDDLKNRRKFLRRSPNDKVTLASLVVGGTVHILGRHLNIVAFGDEYTRKALVRTSETTLAMIKPDAVGNVGPILSALEGEGMKIKQLKMVRMSMAQAQQFYAEHQCKPFYPALTQFMSSGPIVAMELSGENAIQRWRALIGPTNTNTAREQAPNSIRARFGTDGTQNAVHGSDSPSSAAREADFFFGGSNRFGAPAGNGRCSLAVIKPHILAEGKAGEVLQALMSQPQLGVLGLQVHHLNPTNAAEFLEVYDGVVPAFSKHVDELAGGNCMCVCIASKDGNDAVQLLREAAGPHDPEVSRLIRPNTIRARFGVDTVRNGLHVTDLAEDGSLEVDYMFKVLCG